MSAAAFDSDYLAPPGARPLHARPLGSLAATMIGVSALCVLAAAISLQDQEPVNVAQVAAEPPALAEPRALAAPIALDALRAPIETSAAGGTKIFAAFDLGAPEFAKEKKTVSSRRFEQGGREESLTLGQFGDGGPYLRLDVYRPGGEKSGNSDFFLAMTRHASQAGLAAARISLPGPLATRFGAFEAADIRLAKTAGENPAASERSCLAVRLVNPKLPLEIAGLACGAAARPIDRRSMGCILDRLDYLSNGENKALDDFFLNAELDRGKGCAGASLSPNAEKSSWLDAHSSAPPLKSNAAPAKSNVAPARKSKAAR
jgi:hypothetical protein